MVSTDSFTMVSPSAIAAVSLKCFHHFTWFYCNVVEEPAFDKDFAGSFFFLFSFFFVGWGGRGLRWLQMIAGG